MTAPHRLQDLADVLALVEKLRLPLALGGDLHEYVRSKYEELWRSAQHPEEDY